MRKFGLFFTLSNRCTWIHGQNDFATPAWTRTFLIKESSAKALLSGHTNANENVKIQSLHES